MHDPGFQDILKPSMFREINLIRKLGNNAAHGQRIRQEEGLVAIKNLYRFLAFIAVYYADEEPEIQTFSEEIIPTGQQEKEDQKQIKKLEERLEEQHERAKEERKKLEEQARELKSVRNQLDQARQAITERKSTRAKTVDLSKAIPELVSEAQTRKLYIDQSLKEAGWSHFTEGRELEFEVTGMPKSTNKTGVGYVDYVLWGDDGLPLAVIEAKKTMVEARAGKHQATLYADCVEQMFGRRPIIFYTNGHDFYLWDDHFYPERKIAGFLTKNELQLSIDRRKDRKDIRNYFPKPGITGRKYQLEAIQRVSEHWARSTSDEALIGGSRKALLVMATGSGKTRTSASIVDMLVSNGWAKRVLFLADRNALVKQAKDAFNELLPSLASVDLTKEAEESTTRVVFSTYPTMLNKIDKVKNKDQRYYGPGHFDLIIIDEAHRSVYKKYGAIFEYFDGLLLGLTATPKKDVLKNTYELFELQEDHPTFAYELDQAVLDGFLTPPRGITVPLHFLRTGIKYSELSDAEKEEYEAKFGDPTTGEVPDAISSEQLNKWLFNEDTVDKVLRYLMQNGIKVEGGDKLGKTIIFAKNHNHAIYIEERFNIIYPEYSGKFLRVIDNYESKAQDLLDKFVDEDKTRMPQIAVSVDMLDTGVDAPSVVNLVFFKQVKSHTKFWQMIGRGTRLRLDLFGPGMNKEHFLVFDYCQNFEFFDLNPDGIKQSDQTSLSQRIFESKVDIIYTIQNLDDSSTSQKELATKFKGELNREIKTLDRNRFEVKMKLQSVEFYSREEAWDELKVSDIVRIKAELSSLSSVDDGDHELARRFDVLILSMIIALLSGKAIAKPKTRVLGAASKLSKKMNIPAIALQKGFLEEVQSDKFWLSLNEKRLEEVRIALRDLLKFIDKEDKAIVYTRFEDELIDDDVTDVDILPLAWRSQDYKNRVEAYIRININHITIQRLYNNQPITMDELNALEDILFDPDAIGTREEFEKTYGERPLGLLIREIVGLSIESANAAFSKFLQSAKMSADQIRFVDSIIMFLVKNGSIEPAILFEEPFTEQSDQGISGVFEDADAMKIISIVKEVNGSAEAA
jgi:type I restriction enzyme, R subunit